MKYTLKYQYETFYKNTVSIKDNKRFINEAFEYLLEKSK